MNRLIPRSWGEVLVNIFLDLNVFSFSLFHLHLNIPGTLGTFLDMQTPEKSLNDPIINKEAMMISIPKILSISLCSLILSLNLSPLTPAAESTGQDSCADRNGLPNLLKCDEETRMQIVKGSVLRFEFDNLIVRRADGKEVRLHIDENTDMIGYVGPGERIEAKVSNLVDRKHAMSIRQLE